LFDVVKDPTEHEDIAAANPDIVSKLKQVFSDCALIEQARPDNT
jgi:hypothetical protein